MFLHSLEELVGHLFPLFFARIIRLWLLGLDLALFEIFLGRLITESGRAEMRLFLVLLTKQTASGSNGQVFDIFCLILRAAHRHDLRGHGHGLVTNFGLSAFFFFVAAFTPTYWSCDVETTLGLLGVVLEFMLAIRLEI